MLLHFWQVAPELHPIILFVGDSPLEIKMYKYTGSLPTYKECTLTEAIHAITSFLETIFGGDVPKDCSSLNFAETLLKHFCQKNTYTIQSFEEIMKKLGSYFPTREGTPYSNGFCEIKNQAPSLELIPYNSQIFSGTNIINAPYQRPTFENVISPKGKKNILRFVCMKRQNSFWRFCAGKTPTRLQYLGDSYDVF
jgi:hypothetical protein